MFLSERFYKIAAFIFSLLMPVEVWAQPMPTKQVEVRISDEVRIHSNRVVLGDVATIYAKSIRDFEILSSLVITQMPAGDKQMSISSEYLKQRVSEALGGNREFVLHAAKDITFLKEGLGIDPQEAARTILVKGRESGKIPEWVEADVVPISGFEQLKAVRDGEFQIDPAAQRAEWRGNMPFKILLPDEKIAWVRVKIRWFAEAWVAREKISVQEDLSPGDFTKERIEITDLREELIRSDSDLENLLKSSRARRQIREKMALTKSMIDRKPDASPGQRMKVIFVSGSGLRVSADGALISPAIIGENAKVRLNSSRKVVVGRLVSEGVMEIDL